MAEFFYSSDFPGYLWREITIVMDQSSIDVETN
jgi:hypothetical protein